MLLFHCLWFIRVSFWAWLDFTPPPSPPLFLLLHSFLLLLYSSFAGVYSRGFVGVS